MISILAKPLAVLIAFSGILMLAPTSGPQDLTANDQLMADSLTEKVSTTEWLGPLAPVAISPFFGITCLAGMSQFGKGTILEQNNFISNNPVLNNPTIFWVFLVLTLLTSLPRFTKVSKPMAQALDQLETYSGIITLLVMKVLGSGLGGGEGEVLETAALVQFGIFSFTSDLLLSVEHRAVRFLRCRVITFVQWDLLRNIHDGIHQSLHLFWSMQSTNRNSND